MCMPTGNRTKITLCQRGADLPLPLHVAAMCMSPAHRAIQTVEPLAGRIGLRPVVVCGLRERGKPALQRRGPEESVRATWIQPEIAAGGRESIPLAPGRGAQAARVMLSRYDDIGVVVATRGKLLALVVNSFDTAHAYELRRHLSLPDIYGIRFQGNSFQQTRRLWKGIASQSD